MPIPVTVFPAIEPYQQGLLKVDDIHQIYWEVCGNPAGIPVVFLHGGPGGGCSVEHRRLFDPHFYRIVLFDQRGAGRSLPFAELEANTPTHLIADMEQLRQHLHIKQWLIFGGSWGSTLGIAYGEAHPDKCLGFILRGLYMMRTQEQDWFVKGIRHFLPEVWEKFAHFIPESERHDLLRAYYVRVTHADPAIHLPAAKLFSETEAAMSTLLPNQTLIEDFAKINHALALARMETYYMLNFTASLGQQLFAQLARITHLPCILVQGRYDLVCPPVTAYEVAQRWPKANLVMVPDAGHSASEPSLRQALLEATEAFKKILVNR